LHVRHHPDHNPNDVEGAAKRFIHLQESYAVLTDEKAKAAYDALLEAKYV
jgi:DnaJ-class molecular chaperone